jgi:hypothetical protein
MTDENSQPAEHDSATEVVSLISSRIVCEDGRWTNHQTSGQAKRDRRRRRSVTNRGTIASSEVRPACG